MVWGGGGGGGGGWRQPKADVVNNLLELYIYPDTIMVLYLW